MSRDCMDLAWKIQIKPATLKLTLLALCDRADNDLYQAFPSMERLALDTGLNIKTIKSNMKRLQEIGLICDTGERKGATQRVKVIQINKQALNRYDSENGTLNRPENGILNRPENGSQNQSVEPVKESVCIFQVEDGLLNEGFEHFWKNWTKYKKEVNGSAGEKSEARSEWLGIFNSGYKKNNSPEIFKDEVTKIVNFAKHKLGIEYEGRFNDHINLHGKRFLKRKGWK